jgi:hypothetical protein
MAKGWPGSGVGIASLSDVPGQLFSTPPRSHYSFSAYRDRPSSWGLVVCPSQIIQVQFLTVIFQMHTKRHPMWVTCTKGWFLYEGDSGEAKPQLHARFNMWNKDCTIVHIAHFRA